MSAKKGKKDAGSVLTKNRKAFHDYNILETIEAGIELRGTEVKSCRAGNVSLNEGFAKIENGEIFLHESHIAQYEHGNIFNHEAKRKRRLLLHKREILKISGRIKEKGLTLIPLKMYLKRGRVKLELGLAKGKTHGDKRETLRRKQDEVDTKRAIAHHR